MWLNGQSGTLIVHAIAECWKQNLNWQTSNYWEKLLTTMLPRNHLSTIYILPPVMTLSKQCFVIFNKRNTLRREKLLQCMNNDCLWTTVGCCPHGVQIWIVWTPGSTLGGASRTPEAVMVCGSRGQESVSSSSYYHPKRRGPTRGLHLGFPQNTGTSIDVSKFIVFLYDNDFCATILAWHNTPRRPHCMLIFKSRSCKVVYENQPAFAGYMP